MNSPDIVERWIAQLRSGTSLLVPFTTTLYPDTRAERSLLRAEGDGFVLETTFHEFAPGHGWSTELRETESRTESEVRAAFACASVEEVKIATP